MVKEKHPLHQVKDLERKMKEVSARHSVWKFIGWAEADGIGIGVLMGIAHLYNFSPVPLVVSELLVSTWLKYKHLLPAHREYQSLERKRNVLLSQLKK